MSLSPEIISAIAASAAAGAVGMLGWLVNRLWSLYRHEIRDMKQATLSNTAALLAHTDRDEKTFRELTGAIGRLEGAISQHFKA